MSCQRDWSHEVTLRRLASRIPRSEWCLLETKTIPAQDIWNINLRNCDVIVLYLESAAPPDVQTAINQCYPFSHFLYADVQRGIYQIYFWSFCLVRLSVCQTRAPFCVLPPSCIGSVLLLSLSPDFSSVVLVAPSRFVPLILSSACSKWHYGFFCHGGRCSRVFQLNQV